MGAPALTLEEVKSQDAYLGVSPRVRLACKLYATGAVKTKKEASTVAGLHPMTLTVLSNSKQNPKVRMLLQELEAKLESGTIQTSHALQILARRAVMKIAGLMEHSDRQDIQLKAAVELADRSPETQKTQNINSMQLSLGSDDAREIARALVESAAARDKFEHIAKDGLVEVNIDIPQLKESGNGQR